MREVDLYMKWRGSLLVPSQPSAPSFMLSEAVAEALQYLQDPGQSVVMNWGLLFVSDSLPNLSGIAQSLLSVPPSSCCVERLFSAVKIVYSAKRTRLKKGNKSCICLLIGS